MKIAITGSTGFLGSYLVRELKNKNTDFIVLDKEKHDLFDVDSLQSFVENADIICHLAGVAKKSPEVLLRTNTLGTINLLKAIKKFNKRAYCKFIFASSRHVYPMRNVYAYSKKIAEEFIELQSSEGIKGIVLRFSNVYGPNCKPFLNSIIATLVFQTGSGQVLTINGDGNQKRDYVFVADAVHALVDAIKYIPRKNYEVFDICAGKLTSLNEIIAVLERIRGKKIGVAYNDKKENENWDLPLNNNAEKAFGWTPKVSLEEGLGLTMASNEK